MVHTTNLDISQYPELQGVDIDKDARTILRSAQETAQIILQKRKDMDENGQGDEPLRPFLGEGHDRL